MSYTNGLDNPELYFQIKLYTGDGNSTQAITLDGSENMQPDWIWIKNRTDGHYHNLNDSVRGVGAAKVLRSNTNAAESGTSGHVSVIGSNGFTVAAGTSDSEEVNTSSDNYVAWNWKAGTSFTNDASATSVGSIDSAGSINTTAGFSIISYTGTGSAGTVAHGLGVAPSLYIVKNRSSAQSWRVFVSSLGANKILRFNTTHASSTDTSMWNNTSPTSSVFSIGTPSQVNTSSENYIAYCFAEKKGYSKIGSYTGNGGSSGVSNADGTFVYTGFRPAWVMIKRTDSAQQWGIADSKRDVDNPAQHHLFAEDSQAGGASSYNNFDLLSNGFKLRSGDQWTNVSGGTYIYMAFAESPFVNSNGIPNNAR